MDKERFDAVIDLIRGLVTIAIGASAVVIMVMGWLKAQRVKYAERSLGETAIKEMKNTIEQNNKKHEEKENEFYNTIKRIETACEEFKKRYEKEFENFKGDYKELMEKFWAFLENRR